MMNEYVTLVTDNRLWPSDGGNAFSVNGEILVPSSDSVQREDGKWETVVFSRFNPPLASYRDLAYDDDE